MRNFEWVSACPLAADLVARVAAAAGIPFAIASILVALKAYPIAVGLLISAIGVGLVVARSAPRTAIRLDGYSLCYGAGMKADLQTLKSLRVTREFGVERVIVLDGTGALLPLNGIPNDVLDELMSALKERIQRAGSESSDRVR